MQQMRHDSSQIQHQLTITQQQFSNEQKETDRQINIIKKLEEKMETSNKTLAETKKELLQQMHANAYWQQQYQALHVQSEENTKTVIEVKIQLAVVTQKLAITEESLREMTAQNRILVKDKWILEKELAAS